MPSRIARTCGSSGWEGFGSRSSWPVRDSTAFWASRRSVNHIAPISAAPTPASSARGWETPRLPIQSTSFPSIASFSSASPRVAPAAKGPTTLGRMDSGGNGSSSINSALAVDTTFCCCVMAAP